MEFKLEVPLNPNVYGNCFQKCLQFICQYLEVGLDSYELFGIANTLDTEYYGLNYDLYCMGGIRCFTRKNTIEMINASLPFKIYEGEYANSTDAINYVIKHLKSQKPVIALVNPYYMHFMSDYLCNPGGYFNSYHATTIIGYYEDGFIVADPSIDFGQQKISYDEFIKAWTYGEGIGAQYYKPFVYSFFEFDKRKDCLNVKDVCMKSALKNIESIINPKDGEGNGLEGLISLTIDFKYIINTKDNFIINKYLENLHVSIFHELSWTRKQFALFLKCKTFEELNCREEHIETFENLHKKWLIIANIILVGIKSKSKKRLEMSIDRIILLINYEKEEVIKLKTDLISLSNKIV